MSDMVVFITSKVFSLFVRYYIQLLVNSFVPNTPFLYPLKTENRSSVFITSDTTESDPETSQPAIITSKVTIETLE